MIDSDKQKATAQAIASLLLDIDAIKLNPENPFKWSSGWNSPIYCDNRLSLSYPKTRNYIKKEIIEAVRCNYPNVEAIAGVATAGIPQGALVADAMGLPFLYVRSKPKGHGMENRIEGKLQQGQKIVLIEDLISTGGSSLKAAEALKTGGADVLGMVAIFTYGFTISEENFKEAGVPLVCLSNYDFLLKEALKRKYIEEKQLATLKAWRIDPAHWKI